MLSLSLDELADRSDDISTELRAGHKLVLLESGKRIGEIVPDVVGPTDDERRAAWNTMIELMEKGMDLGGKPFTYEERHDR